MLSSLRSEINGRLVEVSLLQASIKEATDSLAALKAEKRASGKALIGAQKAAKLSQDHLADHLSEIVTQAIRAVIQKPYSFICEFVERRGSTEADLFLVKEGEKFDILNSTGGGLADVCSFALKVAYLLLSNVDKVLIIDEVSRHINSTAQREAFIHVMVKLSREFEIQLIINSAIPELVAAADNLITLIQDKEGFTEVVV